jgi:transposase
MRHLAVRVRRRALDVAVVEAGRRPLRWVIPDRPASIRRLVRLVNAGAELRACCEDGPHAYALFWQLAALGVGCDLVSPIGGDVVALAAAHRDGQLAFVWAPAIARAALTELGGW